jgi:uncharacterized protein
MSKSTFSKICLVTLANLLLINHSALAAKKISFIGGHSQSEHQANNQSISISQQLADSSNPKNTAGEDEVFEDIGLNRVEKLKKFLDRGGDPNRYLHAAINSGAIDCVKVMLSNSANVNLVGDEGLTPIMISARVTYRGGVEMTDLLIKKGANVNARAGKGSTALMFAAWGVADHYQDDYVKVVRLLIKHGARVNVKNKMGDTPLIIAKSGNWKKIVATLRKAGAKA